MASRRKKHSEEVWATKPEHVVRCVGTLRVGTRCLRVAEDGTNVCDLHGGAAPQVQRAAAERMVHSAPAAAEALLSAMTNPSVPWGVRVKIMQDVLDRSGLAAAQVHKLVPVAEDPVEKLFQSILDTPGGLIEPPPPEPEPEPKELPAREREPVERDDDVGSRGVGHRSSRPTSARHLGTSARAWASEPPRPPSRPTSATVGDGIAA